MMDGLKKLVAHIGSLKFTQDADIDFLTKLETAILAYVQQRVAQATQAMSANQGATAQQLGGQDLLGGGPGGMPGAEAGASPGSPIFTSPGGGPPGVMPGGMDRLPPVDEMRRLLSGSK